MNIHQKLLGCQNSFSDCYTRINSKCKKFLFFCCWMHTTCRIPRKCLQPSCPHLDSPSTTNARQLPYHATYHAGTKFVALISRHWAGYQPSLRNRNSQNTPRDTWTATSIIRPKARIVEEFGFLNISTARIRQKREHKQILKNMQRHLSTSL